ncbi:MAG: polysaccharide biosynthesis protein [Spirochaetes bacterium]|nr:polysaccharide biosynthesis protein [Spirochaetota bacterium]
MEPLYPISRRKILYIAFDALIITSAYALSFIIRFYPFYKENYYFLNGLVFLVLILSYLIPFYLFQVYRIMWAFSNIKDIYRLSIANIVGFICFLSFVAMLHIPYSRIIVVLTFFMIYGGTIFYRVLIRDYFYRFKEKVSPANLLEKIGAEKEKTDRNNTKILIIGAGEAGRSLLNEYTRRGMNRKVVGFLDDNSYKIGKILNGKTIYGPIDEVLTVIDEKEVNEIVIAIPSASSEVISRIMHYIGDEYSKIPIKVLPSLIEVVDKRPLLSSLRKVGITDLIGREEVSVNTDIIEHEFIDKIILVTGAGGSIGSEICRQLLKFKVKRIIMIGRGEYSIYNLVKSMSESCEFLDFCPDLVYRIVDVKDKRLMEKVFDEFNPDIVFHAAAHKHVPLMEFNEIEAIQNNVFGTNNVIELAHKYRVARFTLISTDKAVCPVNVMGATKRLAELVVLHCYKKYRMNVSIVRFGNVVGSRGSVIPLFQEQIEKGGPVTVTHPDVTRYFMSIPEASLLVINASAFSKGGEIFVLDMGKQYRIQEIAKKLIELYGLRVGVDINIVFTGLRPGEKLYEELSYTDESLRATPNNKINVMDGTINCTGKKTVESLLEGGTDHLFAMNKKEIRYMINDIISEYDHSASSCTDDGNDRLIS